MRRLSFREGVTTFRSARRPALRDPAFPPSPKGYGVIKTVRPALESRAGVNHASNDLQEYNSGSLQLAAYELGRSLVIRSAAYDGHRTDPGSGFRA